MVSGLPLGSIRNDQQGQREPYWQVVFQQAEVLGVSTFGERLRREFS